MGGVKSLPIFWELIVQTKEQIASASALLNRYSLGGKHLVEPGPSPKQLQVLTQAALRAPDHCDLIPFRFCVIQGDAKIRMADLFERFFGFSLFSDVFLTILFAGWFDVFVCFYFLRLISQPNSCIWYIYIRWIWITTTKHNNIFTLIYIF